MPDSPFNPRPSDAECARTAKYALAHGLIHAAKPETQAASVVPKKGEPGHIDLRRRPSIRRKLLEEQAEWLHKQIEVPRDPVPETETFEGGDD